MGVQSINAGTDLLNPITDTESGSVIGIAERYLAPRIVTVEEPDTKIIVPAIVSGRDIQVEYVPEAVFDAYRATPKARRGTAAFTSLDSFIAHFLRFAGEHSAVFARDDRARPGLTGVLDYHDAGEASTPRHMRHRSTYSFPLSDEWKAWSEGNATAMKMGEFARFLEDRIVDVLPVPGTAGIPALDGDIAKFVDAVGGVSKIASPAKLLEMANGLKVHENSAVEQSQNVSSGEVELKFRSEHRDEAGQLLRVPSLFIIGIPVFHNGAPYRIAASLSQDGRGYRVLVRALAFRQIVRSRLRRGHRARGGRDAAAGVHRHARSLIAGGGRNRHGGISQQHPQGVERRPAASGGGHGATRVRRRVSMAVRWDRARFGRVHPRGHTLGVPDLQQQARHDSASRRERALRNDGDRRRDAAARRRPRREELRAVHVGGGFAHSRRARARRGAAWGFRFKTIAFTWRKTVKHVDSSVDGFRMGMGYWTRKQSEVCFLFTKGKPRRLGKGVRQILNDPCIDAPKREHSRKPDEQYGRIEALVGGPYVELFARTARPGWQAWGNEVGKFAA